jgi:hypothetical protein
MRMDKKNPKWKAFIKRLEGPEGCNFKETGKKDDFTWTCAGGKDKTLATKILKDMGLSEADIAASMEYFEDNGGYCDCEIIFNVAD